MQSSMVSHVYVYMVLVAEGIYSIVMTLQSFDRQLEPFVNFVHFVMRRNIASRRRIDPWYHVRTKKD